MNRVILKGRVVRDLELKNVGANNTPVVNFTLAVDKRTSKDKEKQADFISVKALGKTAEFIAKYFSKGKEMLVEGRIDTGSYEKDGKKVYTTDVLVENVEFTNGGGNGGGQKESAPETEAAPEEELDF
jgi:single-strand DNA-binding protein